MVNIEEWMKTIPQIKNGKNKLKVYAYLYYFYINNLPIHPSTQNISEVCEIAQPRVIDAIKVLKDDGVINYQSGKFGKNSHRANNYILNEDFIPEKFRAEKPKEVVNTDLDYDLIGYVSKMPSEKIPDMVKSSLINWIVVTQPKECTIQFKIMADKLAGYCKVDGKVDWVMFKNRVDKSTQRGWHSIIYDDEIEKKRAKDNQFINHKTLQL